MKLAVCPHDAKQGLEPWKGFIRTLEDKLKESVELISFESFEEEKKRVEEEIFDLYYASPDTALSLWKKGYKPVGKFAGQRDTFLLVGRKGSDSGEVRSLALVDLKAVLFSFLKLKSLDIDRIRLHYTEHHSQTIEEVLKGNVDAGLVYEDFYYHERPEGLEILERISMEVSHLFMAGPEAPSDLKDALLSMEGVEPASEKDIDTIRKLDEELERMLRSWEEHTIAKAISEMPHLGVVIYRDKVEYADKTALDLLGYTPEEIRQLSVEELVPEEIRPLIRRIKESRLRGEAVYTNFREIEALTKDGRRLPILSASYPILYRGHYAGFVVFIDISKKKRLERLYSLLREVNSIITGAELEEELFERLCESLVERFQLKLVWVGHMKDGKVDVISWRGRDEGLLRIVEEKVCPSCADMIASAIRKDRIHIIEDAEGSDIGKECRDILTSRGFLSVAFIPVKVKDADPYVLSLYAGERGYFEEENAEVLMEIKRDVEFALRRLRATRMSTVVFRALEASHDWVLITDGDGRIVYVNDRVCELSGYSREEIIGRKPNIFKSGIHPKEFYEELWNTILSGRTFYAVITNRAKDGRLFTLESTIMPVELPGGKRMFVGIGRDITHELELSKELDRLMFYDPLTGLPNLQTFVFRVSEILTQKGDTKGALILMDLSNFAFINRTYGFRKGDKVLKIVAQRLREAFRTTDLISRTQGDEFALFVHPIKRREDVFSVVEKLRNVVGERIQLNGDQVKLSMNAGVAIYPEDGTEFFELYEKARLALSEARERGEEEVVFYNRELEIKAEGFLKAKNIIEKALERNLFVYEFQPYFRVDDLRVAGLEALIRIRNNRRVYLPSEFIDYLERSPYLREFHRVSLRELERLAGRWEVPISVNLSGRSFQDKEYMESLKSISQRHPGKLIVEITERILVENMDRAVKILESLREHTKVVVDDFGTGYSSLSYLRDLPVDMVKIDMSFTKAMIKDPKSRALVETIVDFCNKIGLESLAEGVETEEQLRAVKEIGCTYAQGFYLARPMPEEKVDELLKG